MTEVIIFISLFVVFAIAVINDDAQYDRKHN
jgi:hypothetical protein